MDGEKKKYRVVLDRPNCIGVGACVAVHEKRWTMNRDDDKVDLIGGTVQPDGSHVMEFTEEELELFMESARVCPVLVIHVFEIETGKQLI